MAGWMEGGSASLCMPRATWVTAFGELCPSGWARLSPLTGLWASRAETNTGKPVNYERTSQPVAQPLVKPSLTSSPASGPVTPDTDRSCWGKKKGRTESVFLWGTSCPFCIARLSSCPPNHLSCGGNCGGGSWQGQSEVQEQHSQCRHPTLLLHFCRCAAKNPLL